jgi:hypothetical protein
VLFHKKTPTPTMMMMMMMMIHRALKMPRRYCPNSLPSARLSWLDRLSRIFKGGITTNRGVTVQGEAKATSAPLVEAGEAELRPWQEDVIRRSGKAMIASLSNTSEQHHMLRSNKRWDEHLAMKKS